MASGKPEEKQNPPPRPVIPNEVRNLLLARGRDDNSPLAACHSPRPSKHFRPPQIVEVHDAFEPPASVYNQERRNSARFHQVQRARGEFLAADSYRMRRHAVARRQAQGSIGFALEKTPQVAVRNNSHQSLSLSDHRRKSQALLADFINDVGEASIR